MSDTPTPRMSACTETCDELGFPTDAYDVGCQLECELTAANERIAELTMRVDRVLASTPNIGLAMAEDLSKRCDYAFALCGPENVNWADAGQFFLAGYDHARKAWRTADRDGTKGAS